MQNEKKNNGFWSKFDNFVMFSFWDMVYFVLNIRNELVWVLKWIQKKKIILGGPLSPKPRFSWGRGEGFSLAHPSPPGSGYFWIESS